jgi:hypothetical protein
MTVTAGTLKQVAMRLANEVSSNGDLETFEEIFSDQYVHHNIPVPGIPGTKAGFKQLVPRSTSFESATIRSSSTGPTSISSEYCDSSARFVRSATPTKTERSAV